MRWVASCTHAFDKLHMCNFRCDFHFIHNNHYSYGVSIRRSPNRTGKSVCGYAESRYEVAATTDRPLGEVRFLTVAEVAAVMRVSKMTVYRLVHGGELPAVRVGRSFRVPEQAVHAYLRDSFVEAG